MRRKMAFRMLGVVLAVGGAYRAFQHGVRLSDVRAQFQQIFSILFGNVSYVGALLKEKAVAFVK
jgi:hypothetical protein